MNCYLIKRGNKYSIRVYEHDEYGVIKKDAKGNPVHRTIATGTSDEKEARRILVEYQYKYNTGSYVSPDQMAIRHLADHWINNVVSRDCEASTLSGYSTIVNRHLTPELGDVRVQKITPAIVDTYITKKIKAGLSANTVNKHLICLRSMLDYACTTMRIINLNPCTQVRRIKVDQFEGKYLTDGQVKDLFIKCKGHRIEIPVYLATILGMRLSEVCGLRWTDVDFNNNKLTIVNSRLRVDKQDITKKPKTKSSKRVLPLPAPLKTLLMEEKDRQENFKKLYGKTYKDSPYVVRNEDGYIVSPKRISKLFKEFIEKYGLEEIRYHDLRHTFITHLLQKRVPLKTIQKLTGHSTADMILNRYGHVIEGTEIQAIENHIETLFD